MGAALIMPQESEDACRALFAELGELGLNVQVCGATLRKLRLAPEALPQGVQASSMKALSALMSQGDEIITF